jgi:HTH-type transcriptional regulator/antitoxin HigA
MLFNDSSELAGGAEHMGEISHPGKRLAAELERRGWSQSDLTFVLGCHPKAVNQIINGKQGVSPAMSKALGDALGLPANQFMSLQRDFDLAEASEPDSGVQLRSRMLANYPVREMMKRRWLRSGDAGDLSTQLSKFFEVDGIGDVPYLAHAAKKSTYEEKEIQPTQLAWLFRVRQIAKKMGCVSYSRRALEEAITRMRGMLLAPEECRHVPRVLSECGIRFVIVEALPQSKIDGVCFWLDDKSPVIGMSIRFDRIDNFWFVLRHECEHVLRQHGRKSAEGMIDADIQSTSENTGVALAEEERVANEAAQDFCVPHEKMISFFHRKNPFFYEKDVLAFAKLNSVHPGLPVGQIQHMTGRYEHLKKHQVKVREFVLPGAMADGWDRPLETL